MRRTVLTTGLFLCAISFVASNQHAHAMSSDALLATKTTNIISLPVVKETKKKELNIATSFVVVEEKQAPNEATKVTEPVKYKVEPNDSLVKIASKYQTTWVRLFDKNTQIENPDLIKVNEELIIPLTDEVIASRPIPVKSPPAIVQAPVAPISKSPAATRPRAAVATNQQTYVARGSSSGNTYTAGYCTWYVKNRRPDLPNNLGNADTWVTRASAQGLPTGSAPRPGAVGQKGMHVVYVESVNGDGSVNISEMNREGLYVVSYRTVPASYFLYIY